MFLYDLFPPAIVSLKLSTSPESLPPSSSESCFLLLLLGSAVPNLIGSYLWLDVKNLAEIYLQAGDFVKRRLNVVNLNLRVLDSIFISG